MQVLVPPPESGTQKSNSNFRFKELSMWGTFVEPCGSDGKGTTCDAGDPGSTPGAGRFPWRRKGQPTPVFCLGNPTGYSPWGHKELDPAECLTLLLSHYRWGGCDAAQVPQLCHQCLNMIATHRICTHFSESPVSFLDGSLLSWPSSSLQDRFLPSQRRRSFGENN